MILCVGNPVEICTMAKIKRSVIVQKMTKAVENSGDDRSVKSKIADEKKGIKTLKALMKGKK